MPWGSKILVLSTLLVAASRLMGQGVEVPLGNFSRVLDQLELENHDGSKVPLNAYKEKELTVMIFLAHDCPICQKYGDKFRELSASRAQVQVIGIAPADGATKELIGSYAATFGFEFPILLDEKKVLAHVLKGKVTPEVFLFNNVGDLLYRGKIDNWFYELGKYRQVVTEHYLDNAIKAALAGEAVSPNKTEPVGCLLNMGMQH
jgi:thiol-disulfide isomerase/thioredoxin